MLHIPPAQELSRRYLLPLGVWLWLLLIPVLCDALELEATGADVDDDLASELMTFLSHSQMGDSLQSDDLHHVSYSVHDCEKSSEETVVTCRVTAVFNEVGLKIWEAGWFLAEYILAYPEFFRDRCVLELGAGVGFSGLVLAACTRPRRVLLSDYAPNVMQNLRYNVEINSSKYRCPVDVVTLDWDTWQPSEQGDELQPDILLAGDCVYDIASFPSLVRVLHAFMDMPSERQRMAIFASTIRNQTTFQAFLDQLEQFEIEYLDVTTEALQAMGQQSFKYVHRDQIRLCHLSRAKSSRNKLY